MRADPDYVFALVLFQDNGRGTRTVPVLGTERNTEEEATLLAGDRRANGDAFPGERVERFPADVWQLLVEALWRGERKWTPPPPPKPHQWRDDSPLCGACGIKRNGSLAKLNCGTPVNNLTAKDRAEAAQAVARG